MRKRANQRGKSCNVSPLWSTYIGFKSWSLSNGYNDTLVLCRNGDVGDYSPDNARWDTKGNNAREACSKVYKLLSPDKTLHIGKGISEFKEKHKLGRHIFSVVNGTRKSHKGWTKYVE
jgi:hypothetical protein